MSEGKKITWFYRKIDGSHENMTSQYIAQYFDINNGKEDTEAQSMLQSLKTSLLDRLSYNDIKQFKVSWPEIEG